MSTCFAYIRVSTTKQEDGVSLEAQRDAITAYAQRHGLVISEWFQESQTAAKRGRSEFTRMLDQLKKGDASGVIIHKIDRSARNLRDWADFAELMDHGIEIHLAGESLDLTSRGGRLVADVQAVVAADFIRNLREETRKGLNGRLRQGLLPGPAPIGYLDGGRGQPKTIDPVHGPLVREMFQRYATGRHTLTSIAAAMSRFGLRTTAGKPIDKNVASRILNNTFYMGLITRKRTGEVFEGVHETLISKRLYDAVQAVLEGKSHPKRHKHTFVFRRLIRCGLCDQTMVPERQKGHVYYRCHERGCATKCLREERIEAVLQREIRRFTLTEEEYRSCLEHLKWYVEQRKSVDDDGTESLKLEAAKVTDRLSRLTDLLIDGGIDREAHDEKRRALLMRKRELEESIREREEKPYGFRDRVVRYLELALEASLSYELGSVWKKQELVKTFTSNRTVRERNVAVELRKPFYLLAQRTSVMSGSPRRDVPRKVVAQIAALAEEENSE